MEKIRYTVYHNNDSSETETGLSLSEAAYCLLTYDGHAFEIRNEGEAGFALWVTPYSRSSTLGSMPMRDSTIYSIKGDKAQAHREIYLKVVQSGYWSPMGVMPDQKYKDMIAYLEKEESN